MTIYQYINTNIDRIRCETKIGLISTTILHHHEIYSRYDLYRRKMDHSVVTAVLFTASDLRVSERVVYRVIKKMESKI